MRGLALTFVDVVHEKGGTGANRDFNIELVEMKHVHMQITGRNLFQFADERIVEQIRIGAGRVASIRTGRSGRGRTCRLT